MVRGTFANVRLKNQLAGGKEGGYTVHLPSGDLMTIFDASGRYRTEKTPLIVLAGKSYGQGSSRDWAAKGPRLLGVGAVIAESYERIHRVNLIEMGVLPLAFRPGRRMEAARSHGSRIVRPSPSRGNPLRTGVYGRGRRPVGERDRTEVPGHLPVEFEDRARLLPGRRGSSVRHGPPLREVDRILGPITPTVRGRRATRPPPRCVDR